MIQIFIGYLIFCAVVFSVAGLQVLFAGNSSERYWREVAARSVATWENSPRNKANKANMARR